MDHRLIQPASRDQIVAIIRQRAERANRDLPAHLGQVGGVVGGGGGSIKHTLQALFPAPAFIDFPGRDKAREADRPPVYRSA